MLRFRMFIFIFVGRCMYILKICKSLNENSLQVNVLMCSICIVEYCIRIRVNGMMIHNNQMLKCCLYWERRIKKVVFEVLDCILFFNQDVGYIGILRL